MIFCSLFVVVFYANGVSLFFRIAANDRGYGHGRFAGVFAVAQQQTKCGNKTLQNARQPACEHSPMMLGVRHFAF